MRKTHKSRSRFALQVESLEGKALLSGVHAAVHPHLPPQVTAAATTAVGLNGSFQGAYYGGGGGYGFTTHGQLTGIGTGNLYGGIFLRGTPTAGRYVGTLEEINGRSTMTIRLTESAASSSGLPSSFAFKVIVATGNDRAERGQTGTVSIALNGSTNYYFYHGRSTITFTPSA